MAELSGYRVKEQRVRSLDLYQVEAALNVQNPQTPAGEIAEITQVLSLMLDIVMALPKAGRDQIMWDQSQFRAALGEALERINVEQQGEIETTRGDGLGEVLDLEEGRARLDGYATFRKLQDWAGEVAGAGQIEALFGIKRSTLASWYQQGAVVGLLRGQRKLAYPIAQFVDERPLEGLGELLKLAPDARSAWLWVRQPHGALEGRSPLDLLREGHRAKVIAVAKQDFA